MKNDIEKQKDKENIFGIYAKYLKIFTKHIILIKTKKINQDDSIGNDLLNIEKDIDKFLDELKLNWEPKDLLMLSQKILNSSINGHLKSRLLHWISIVIVEIYDEIMLGKNTDDTKDTLTSIL